MAGILVSIAVACFIAVQASAVGAPNRITIPVAGIVAGVMAALWSLAMETLFPDPDMWNRVFEQMAFGFVVAGFGAAGFTWAAGNLIAKIVAFKEKYPDR